jgi:pimeloyl-ACP methyl ester carboxylesterase
MGIFVTIKFMATMGALLAMAGGSAQAGGFAPCGDAGDVAALAGSLCARVEAPLVPSDADGASIELFVRKFPVADGRPRRGEVWLVAGGPGEAGASFYPALPALRRAFPDFELVMPDHRGTGYSTKLCPLEEAPESAAGIDLAGEEWGTCIASMYANPARTQAFSITHAAHDLSSLIRTHRGDGPVHLYGVSYGTQLALRMLQVAPVELDGLVLDGLVPPEGAAEWEISQRTRIADAVGRAYLTPEQRDTVARLVAHAQSGPAWLGDVPGKDIRQFMGRLLDFPMLRARIPALAEELLRDDSTLLFRTVADLGDVGRALLPVPQSPSSMPLVMLITGSENNSRTDLTREAVAKDAEGALFTSPLPGLAVEPPVPLYRRDAAFGNLPARLPRTLVIQGTLDPATPIEGARAHIAALSPRGDIHLTTVNGGAHALVLTGQACFVEAVSAFMAGARVPNVCHQAVVDEQTGAGLPLL